MNALATQLGEATPLVWLVPLLPLLAAAAIAMRMLFCREHGHRQEPFTAGLASAAALGALFLLLLFDLAAPVSYTHLPPPPALWPCSPCSPEHSRRGASARFSPAAATPSTSPWRVRCT